MRGRSWDEKGDSLEVGGQGCAGARTSLQGVAASLAPGGSTAQGLEGPGLLPAPGLAQAAFSLSAQEGRPVRALRPRWLPPGPQPADGRFEDSSSPGLTLSPSPS